MSASRSAGQLRLANRMALSASSASGASWSYHQAELLRGVSKDFFQVTRSLPCARFTLRHMRAWRQRGVTLSQPLPAHESATPKAYLLKSRLNTWSQAEADSKIADMEAVGVSRYKALRREDLRSGSSGCALRGGLN